MWNQLTPQQQQFFVQLMMGNWGGMTQQGLGNPLMVGGGWQQGALPQGSNGIAGAYFGGNPQQTTPLPPGSNGIAGVYFGGNPQQQTPLPMQPPMPLPQQSPPGVGQMPDWLQQGQPPPWLQQQAAQNYAQQAALAQTQQTGYLPAQQWGQQQMAPQDVTNGQGQQRLPDYSGGGPSISPYAMPGTVQWGG
jgi:hypothetical protein